MSSIKHAKGADLYIHRLKTHFGVKQDDELGNAVGVSKQAISNWRSRGNVPLKFQQRMYDENNIPYNDWLLDFDTPFGDLIYGLSYYAINSWCNKNGIDLNQKNLRLIGHLHPLVVRALSDEMSKIANAWSSPETLLNAFIAYVDSGRFLKLDSILSQALEDE